MILVESKSSSFRVHVGVGDGVVLLKSILITAKDLVAKVVFIDPIAYPCLLLKETGSVERLSFLAGELPQQLDSDRK